MALVAVFPMFLGLGNALGQNGAWNTGSTEEPDGRGRTFDLIIANHTNERITCSVSDTSCCDSPVSGADSGWIGSLAASPSNSKKLWVARVQGNGCDGQNGWFRLSVRAEGSGIQDFQAFTFNNGGSIAVVQSINRFHGVLSGPNAQTGAYTYSVYPIASRLPSPVDERLSIPRDRIAADSGLWGEGTTQVRDFRFTPVNGTQGNFYDSCFGIELFHPQHVVRLPNKNGRAYFMLASSRAHNGSIHLLETYPGVLDPQTDLLNWTNRTTRIGEYVWMDLFTGSFNGTFNPIGNWNHPGKMDLVGNVLAVSVQNWAESAPCFYGAGDSEDAVLFYDVRDPRNPVYWGKLTASELGVPSIDGMGILRRPATDDYELWITGGAGDDRVFVRWKTATITPQIQNWTSLGSGGDAKQHGGFFSSYQLTAGSTFNGGYEKQMFFGADPESDTEFQFLDYSGGPNRNYGLPLPGAYRHWVSESLYVTKQGVPVIYTMESGNQYGSDGILYQVTDTRNATLQTPHPDRVVTNVNDRGPGSLREAIGYGGNITFAPALNGQTITLTSGPLVAHQYDAALNATALPNGLAIVRQNSSLAPALMVTDGNSLTQTGLKRLTMISGGVKPFGEQATTKHSGVDALQSGSIAHNQQSDLRSKVTGPGTLTFWWKVSSEVNYDFLRFELDGAAVPTVAAISGEVNWQQVTVDIPTGSHSLRWFYSKDVSASVGSDAGWLDDVSFTEELTLPGALDTSTLTWSLSGNANWMEQAAVSHDGDDAARSGAISHNETSVLGTQLTGPGTLSFWWKVSSEADYDFLRFQLDGAEFFAISGEEIWHQRTVFIPVGTHSVQWLYTKDESESFGNDAGWLDEVTFQKLEPVVQFDASTLAQVNNTALTSWGGQTAVGSPMLFMNQTPAGKPAVIFDGTDRMGDNIMVPASAAQDFIIAAVIRPDSIGAYHNVIDDDAQTSPMLWVRPDFLYEMNFGASNTACGRGPGGWDVIIVDSRLNQIYLNSPTANASGRDGTAHATSRAFDFFHRDGAQTFRGKVAELRVYNDRAAFGADFASLYGELKTKWIGTPYTIWVNANIPIGRDASFEADGNGNGISNGIEYALGAMPIGFTPTGDITAPSSIPSDVDIVLERNRVLQTSGWTAISSWLDGNVPVLGAGVTLSGGAVQDSLGGTKAFYRYRVIQRN